jgi:S-methylmethionine-dependent homocysteine/selenocysteine methylase
VDELKAKVEAKLDLLKAEAEILVNEREAIIRRVEEIDTRLTQVVGGMEALSDLV